jgi:hypothetical protein
MMPKPPADRPTAKGPSLSDLVLELADNPNRATRDALVSTLTGSRVGARVPAGLGRPPIPSGTYVTERAARLPIPIGRAPDGSPAIVVLSDVPDLVKGEPATSFVEFAATDIIKIAIANHAGIVVQASKNGRQAWVLLSKIDVAHLGSGAASDGHESRTQGESPPPR